MCGGMMYKKYKNYHASEGSLSHSILLTIPIIYVDHFAIKFVLYIWWIYQKKTIQKRTIYTLDISYVVYLYIYFIVLPFSGFFVCCCCVWEIFWSMINKNQKRIPKISYYLSIYTYIYLYIYSVMCFH